MGFYQKIGVRDIALNIDQYINWVRQYGLKDGSRIFKVLKQNKPATVSVVTTRFPNPIYLRNNYSDKAIFNQVFYEKQYFLEQLNELNVTRILDAGANIGLAAIYFNQLFPAAQIIAIEPEPSNYLALQKNTSSYKNITCQHAALWHEEEAIDIINPGSLAASFMVEKNSSSSIKGITIPKLMQQHDWDKIDVLKMDIEGAEKNVFEGNVEWLKNVQVIIIELHDNYKPGCTKVFFKAIEPYEYQAFFRNENIFIFFNHS